MNYQMDQEDDTIDREEQNIKEQKYQVQDSGKQKNMKIFMIFITIINIFQTLLNCFIYNYIPKFFSFEFSYDPDPTLQNYRDHKALTISCLACYPIMIISFRCFHKSPIFKKLSTLIILLFFVSFTLFTCQLYRIFLFLYTNNSQQQFLFFYLAIIDLLAAYLLNSIYLSFTNYLIERSDNFQLKLIDFQIIQSIATIIVTIIYMTWMIFNIKETNSDNKYKVDYDTVSFQFIISILYFQGIMTFYLMIQLYILFQTLNGNLKLQLNDILHGYMQIQTRIFLFCFKD